jgi:hypothetical protein
LTRERGEELDDKDNGKKIGCCKEVEWSCRNELESFWKPSNDIRVSCPLLPYRELGSKILIATLELTPAALLLTPRPDELGIEAHPTSTDAVTTANHGYASAEDRDWHPINSISTSVQDPLYPIIHILLFQVQQTSFDQCCPSKLSQALRRRRQTSTPPISLSPTTSLRAPRSTRSLNPASSTDQIPRGPMALSRLRLLRLLHRL